MIHPSSLLFLDGHLETTPDYDFADDPIHMILPFFPVLKAQDTRHSAPASTKFGCLAKSDANTPGGAGILRNSATRTVWVQKFTQDGKVNITKIPGASNPADLGTKHLDGGLIR